MDSPEDKAAGKFFSVICFLLYYFFCFNTQFQGRNCPQKGIFHTSLHIHFVTGYRKYSAFMIALLPLVDPILLLTDKTSRMEMKSNSRRPA